MHAHSPPLSDFTAAARIKHIVFRFTRAVGYRYRFPPQARRSGHPPQELFFRAQRLICSRTRSHPLSASDPASAAAHVAASAAAAVCSILKGGPAELLAQPAAAAAAALTAIPAGAQQFVECGGVVALKKAAAMGDSVKVCVCIFPLLLGGLKS